MGSLQTPRCTTNAQGLHTVTGFHNNGSNDSHARQVPPLCSLRYRRCQSPLPALCVLCALCGEPSSVFSNGDAAVFWVGSLQTPRPTTNVQRLHTVTGFHNNGSNDSHARQEPSPFAPFATVVVKALSPPSVVNPAARFPSKNAQGLHTVTRFHNNDSDEIDARKGLPVAPVASVAVKIPSPSLSVCSVSSVVKNAVTLRRWNLRAFPASLTACAPVSSPAFSAFS